MAAAVCAGEVATGYGARDQRGVSVHRDSLIQKGLIWSPRRGQLDFTVPLFAEFLRENHPSRRSTTHEPSLIQEEPERPSGARIAQSR
jgi:hypothetical protein